MFNKIKWIVGCHIGWWSTVSITTLPLPTSLFRSVSFLYFFLSHHYSVNVVTLFTSSKTIHELIHSCVTVVSKNFFRRFRSSLCTYACTCTYTHIFYSSLHRLIKFPNMYREESFVSSPNCYLTGLCTTTQTQPACLIMIVYYLFHFQYN